MTMRYSKMPSNRQLKVSEELRKQISQLILRGDVYHPVFDGTMISITDVRISPDLRVATVFFNHTGGVTKNLATALNAFVPEIKRVLAGKINLRFMPDVRFVYDHTIDDSVKIEGILNG